MKKNGMEDTSNAGLECSICLRILFEPVSTICGHSFCKSCLGRSMGYKQECPTCRAVCSGTIAVNIALSEILRARFPQEYAARVKESVDGQSSVSSNDDHMFLAVYPVKFTETLNPFRSLRLSLKNANESALKFARDSGSNKLIFVPTSSNSLLGLVVDVVAQESGEYMQVKASHRCRIVGPVERHDRGCMVARCVKVSDSGLSNLEKETCVDKLIQIKEMLDHQFLLLGEFGKDQFVNALGHVGSLSFFEKSFLLSSDMRHHMLSGFSVAQFEHISFVLLHILHMDSEMKSLMIQSEKTIVRLDGIKAFLTNAGRKLMISPKGEFESTPPRLIDTMLRMSSTESAIMFCLVILVLLVMKGNGWFEPWRGG